MMTLEARTTGTKRAGIRSRRATRVALGALALILGLACLAFGGAVFASAHNTHSVEVDGTVADYHEITINGAYARNDLRLTNNAHTYTFDSRQFHPALPQRFQKDARIQIWVDQGTTTVLAITLYDEMGINPTTYTTSAYDNPTLAFATTEGEAGALAAFGIALEIAGGVSLLFRAKRHATAQPGSARAVPQPAPVAFGPAQSAASQPHRPQHLPAVSPITPSAMPSANGAGLSPISLSQAAPTTPAPNRRAHTASSTDVGELPTQKSPAVAPTKPPSLVPSAPAEFPDVQPVQPGSAVTETAASPFAAWGIASQPRSDTTQTPPMRPPSLQPVAPPAQPQASAPPGSLADFPTERMPTASGATPGDVSEEPTRKSETVAPPDIAHQ